ncbi:MAG: hypothetical protein WDZ47_00065, partial [Bacteroidales bacterium]
PALKVMEVCFTGGCPVLNVKEQLYVDYPDQVNRYILLTGNKLLSFGSGTNVFQNQQHANCIL